MLCLKVRLTAEVPYSGCRFLRSENVSPLSPQFTFILIGKISLELFEVFRTHPSH